MSKLPVEKPKKNLVKQGATETAQQVKAVVTKCFGSAKGKNSKIPNASLIYGVAAAALFAFAALHLTQDQYLFAILLAFLAILMFGYALVYLRSGNN